MLSQLIDNQRPIPTNLQKACPEIDVFLSADTPSSFDQSSTFPEANTISLTPLSSCKSLPEIISSNQIHICEDCGKVFSRSSYLKIHSKKHSKPSIFICEICQKAFTQKGNLKTHSKVHTGEKAFSCCVCFAKFSTKGHLTDHFRRHTGERPFVCRCGKGFMRSSTLNKHLLSHSEAKRYNCEYCNKGFIDSGNLKTHLRTHTGERPFVCEIVGCDKRFKTKKHLADHMNSKLHLSK